METGKFYGASILEDIVPLNKEYNKTRNQTIEAKQRSARNQLLIAEGSVDVNRMTSEEGGTVIYKPGYPVPTPLPARPIPAFVQEEANIIKADMLPCIRKSVIISKQFVRPMLVRAMISLGLYLRLQEQVQMPD